MTKYCKRPTEVEAWQVGSDEPMPKGMSVYEETQLVSVALYMTRCGVVAAAEGEYIIVDEVLGLAYSVKPDIFEQTYEVVE